MKLHSLIDASLIRTIHYSDFRMTIRLLRACVRNSLGESGFRESNRREFARLAAITTATIEIERNERAERGG